MDRASRIEGRGMSNEKQRKPIQLELRDGEDPSERVARMMLAPYVRHGQVFSQTFSNQFETSTELPVPDTADYANAIKSKSDAAAAGELEIASRMLMAQAITLDGLFTELARRSVLNLSQHYEAAETYMRQALKAQSGSRQTLEALARLHQPREQTVRHVHVNEGGQAIVADQFHQHTGGSGNGKAVEQCHEPGRSIASGPALPGKDPTRDGVPVPQDQRPKTLSTPRRTSGRSTGKPQRAEARRPLKGNHEND
jgi:hypothetical protein